MFYKYKITKSGMGAHTCNPCTWEAKAGEPGLHSKFSDSLDYIKRHCPKKKNQKNITAK